MKGGVFFLCLCFYSVFLCSLSLAQLDQRIQYSTYLSGSKTSCFDQGGNPCPTDPPIAHPVAVAVDGSGNIFVTGITNETDFPNTKGQSVPIYCSTDGSSCRPATAFLAKFSRTGQLMYSAFLPF